MVQIASLILVAFLLHSAQSSSLNLQRFWTVSCRTDSCEKAFQLAVDNKCLGKRQCKSIITEYYPECSKCADEILAVMPSTTMNTEIQTTTRFYNTLNGHNGGITSFLELDNGDLVSSSNDGTIIIWNRGDGSVKFNLTGHKDWVRSVVLLPNGELASGSYDRKLHFWNPNDGTLKKIVSAHTFYMECMILLGTDQIVTGSFDIIRVWSQNGTLLMDLEDKMDKVLAFADLGKGLLASSSFDGTIRIWDLQMRTVTLKIKGNGINSLSLAVLPNGDLVAGCEDGNIRIWDPVDGTLKKTLTGHTGEVITLTVLHNGDLVSGSSDKTIKIWDIEEGTLKKTLSGHTRDVLSLKELRNGKLLSGSYDRTIRIWSLA